MFPAWTGFITAGRLDQPLGDQARFRSFSDVDINCCFDFEGAIP